MHIYHGKSAENLLILFHGYGANGADLYPIGEMIQAACPHLSFCLPEAPWLPEGVQGWFSRDSFDTPHAGKALDFAAKNWAETHAPLLESHPTIILAGFSQGGMLALQLGYSHISSPLVISYAGGMHHTTPVKKGDSSQHTLFFHGAQDDVVPVAYSQTAAIYYEENDLPQELIVTQGAKHWIHPSWIEKTVKSINNMK